jgi:hypothetical protein
MTSFTITNNKILYKKKNKLKISISSKSFRIYDSIVNRRLKILRRLRVINLYLYKMLFLKYQGLRWLKEIKLIRGFMRYKRELYFLESQGLKRKMKKNIAPKMWLIFTINTIATNA